MRHTEISSDSDLRSSVFGLRTSVFGPRASVFGLGLRRRPSRPGIQKRMRRVLRHHHDIPLILHQLRDRILSRRALPNPRSNRSPCFASCAVTRVARTAIPVTAAASASLSSAVRASRIQVRRFAVGRAELSGCTSMVRSASENSRVSSRAPVPCSISALHTLSISELITKSSRIGSFSAYSTQSSDACGCSRRAGGKSASLLRSSARASRQSATPSAPSRTSIASRSSTASSPQLVTPIPKSSGTRRGGTSSTSIGKSATNARSVPGITIDTGPSSLLPRPARRRARRRSVSLQSRRAFRSRRGCRAATMRSSRVRPASAALKPRASIQMHTLLADCDVRRARE